MSRALGHRLRMIGGVTRRALPDQPVPEGPFLPAGSLPALPEVLRDELVPVLAAAAAVGDPVAHGPFDPREHALRIDLFRPGDIRPVWERNRLAEIPTLALAHRLDPEGGHLVRAEHWLAAWCRANPPYRGPNWACAQEASLRMLHLMLAHALLGGGAASPGLRALAAVHGRRIAATRRYAEAQDNNHSISEPAGLFACALALGEDAVPHGDALSRAVERLVGPDGGFAQVSTQYHRLLLDVLSVAEWLRRTYAQLPFPEPFSARAAAAARWLLRLVDPVTGAVPLLGHGDGSRFADLSLCGATDARGSAERAARLFLRASAGHAHDPGCRWLELPRPPLLRAEPRWVAEGSRGWNRDGARLLLRTGPLIFRPGQSDLLHLDLWDGPVNLLRDGGTLSYNPAPEDLAVAQGLEDAAGHNTVVFDGAEPMPRAGRFLRARWPDTGELADGAWVLDHRGNRHARRVSGLNRAWVVSDELAGPFRRATLRWRLAPAAWEMEAQGLRSPLGRISISADAPLRLWLEEGWEAPRYGQRRPVPVLLAEAEAPVNWIVTLIRLPPRPGDSQA
ncbi:heparinase II/III domain-containing protein [Roseomonas elaeocarpi]|uniref:Heparinase II/III family protein n=1 Tax=Roseomonas elaeocarpi TaxID=907779 RepID=A0ABV6JWL9_9PROT